MCPEIKRLFVSTDDPEIAEVASQYGVEVPFLRPAHLAEDETPLWPVLRHALFTVEALAKTQYEYLLLLDPTSPARIPEDVALAFGRLAATPEADGIIAASQPDFNPIWHCVIEKNGWMTDLMDGAADYSRRQDAPPVYRINGLLYIWRTQFVRTHEAEWRRSGRHLIHTLPDVRAVSIDSIEEFERAELLVRHGLIKLPWLGQLQSC